jgi:type I restriction enzyme S subunit
MTDWPVKTLGDLMTVQNGYAFDSQYFSPDGKIGLIRIRDLKNGIATETHFDGPYDDQYVVSAGDYLIGMDGEFRCYEWKGAPALLNQRVCRLRDFGNSLNARFLFYGINKFLKEIEDVTGYTTVKHLSSKSILAIEMPVPPLEEQKRIVALLDEATARVTELTACYEQARAHANNLFTSALRDALESNPDWISGSLDDLCEVEYGTRVTRKRDGGTKYPVYGGGGATFSLDDFNRQDQMIVSRFAMSEECVRFVPGKFFLNDSGLTVRTRDESKMSQEFLDQQLLARSNEIYATARGTAQKNMDMSMFRSMELTYPDSLEEQKRIVAQLDSMKAKTSEMVEAYDAKLNSAKNLRQSILEAAFRGEL